MRSEWYKIVDFMRQAITAGYKDEHQLQQQPWLAGMFSRTHTKAAAYPSLILIFSSLRHYARAAEVVTVPAPGLVEAALLQVLQHALYGWEHILQSAVTVAVALIDACPAKAFDKGG